MTSTEWVTIAIAGIGFGLTLMANIGGTAFFLGQLKAGKESQEALLDAFKFFTTQMIDSLKERLDRGEAVFERMNEQSHRTEIALARATDSMERNQERCDERDRRTDDRFTEVHRTLRQLTMHRSGDIRDIKTV